MSTPQQRAAQQQAADRLAISKEMVGLQMRLRNAGVNFDVRTWRDYSPFWDPTGFEFLCDDVKALQRAAETSDKMGIHSIDLPNDRADPWVAAGIVAVGFSEVNKPKYLHLDIAINRPGLCRLYATERMWALQRDSKGMAKLAMARDNPVYQQVARRLADLTPPINLDEHIGAKVSVGRSTLDGVDFEARDYKRLETLLREAKGSTGEPAFAVGAREDPNHWALSLSYLATKGIGFREIWRPRLSDRPLSMADARPDRETTLKNRYSAHFGDRQQDLPNMTSLHCAVSKHGCNAHIDEMGFVMTDAKGNIILNPNFLRHTLVELFWKTNLKGKIAQGALDRISFDIVSTPLDFARAGVSVDLIQSDKYKLTLRGSCGIGGPFDCSGTLTFHGRF